MRGYPRKAELLPKAQELRAQGLTYREIAERPRGGPDHGEYWLTDPDLAKQRARRERYAGACVDCGTATNGSAGHGATRCDACSRVHATEHGKGGSQRHFGRAGVIAALQQWAREHDGAGPSATDWNVADGARSAEKRAKFYADGCWPHTSCVQRLFGSWNAALAAAQVKPRPQGRPPSSKNKPKVAA